jgi:hypothetical protein
MPDQMIEVMQDIAGKINKSQRELCRITDITGWNTESPLQATSCSETLESGFLPQIPGKTTTPLANRTTKERRHGLSRAILSPNGNRWVRIPCYGFMGNVGV